MKLAIIGNGAMGTLVRTLAEADGHEVARVIGSQDAARSVDELAALLGGHDAVVDFSVAAAVLKNVEAAARAGVPLVEGTTGWNAEEAEARRLVATHAGALVFGANFSVGVQIFYRIAARAAELFAATDYAPFIEEAHHARKRDAPSGTALKLRDVLATHIARDIPVASTRAGHIPGTHRIGFDSAADQITLTHTARTREGFASGALLAARWIKGRRGIYEFSEVMDSLVASSDGFAGGK
jgi:4-hydroxy-tetrahydrodipicolinate reductase